MARDRAEDDGRRVGWVDVAKCAAILAVLLDHTNGILYGDQRVAYASYYSTCLFVLLMGLTTYLSLLKHRVPPSRAVLDRAAGILVPYAVATAIYSTADRRAFVFEDWAVHLARFDASGPLYYVALYLQLLLVCPVLFHCLRRCGRWWHEAALAVPVVAVAVLATNRSDILGIYGGGGRLLGGTYLILLYVGMVFARYGMASAGAGGVPIVLSRVF